mmetsp:Transcript_150559/g.263119  ORF Transcript_150559/g.263119 Transcript_150559/m.263119 type:complete len:317 (+) Transcript_150559:938-1888(+)
MNTGTLDQVHELLVRHHVCLHVLIPVRRPWGQELGVAQAALVVVAGPRAHTDAPPQPGVQRDLTEGDGRVVEGVGVQDRLPRLASARCGLALLVPVPLLIENARGVGAAPLQGEVGAASIVAALLGTEHFCPLHGRRGDADGGRGDVLDPEAAVAEADEVVQALPLRRVEVGVECAHRLSALTEQDKAGPRAVGRVQGPGEQQHPIALLLLDTDPLLPGRGGELQQSAGLEGDCILHHEPVRGSTIGIHQGIPGAGDPEVASRNHCQPRHFALQEVQELLNRRDVGAVEDEEAADGVVDAPEAAVQPVGVLERGDP